MGNSRVRTEIALVVVVAALVLVLLVGCGSGSPTEAGPGTAPAVEATATSIPGLVLYYPFDGNADDMSGNGIDGEVIGAILTADRFGREKSAFFFDGVDDSIGFDAARMPTGSAPRTISAWVKAESFPLPPAGLEGLGSRASVVGWGRDQDRQLSEMQVTEGRLMFHAYNADAWSVSTVELSQWHHLVIVYTGQQVVLYNNGVSEAYDSAVLETATDRGRIGAFSDPTVTSPLFPNGYDLSYFHGVIDDVRVYEAALDADQVLALYHEGGWE